MDTTLLEKGCFVNELMAPISKKASKYHIIDNADPKLKIRWKLRLDDEFHDMRCVQI